MSKTSLDIEQAFRTYYRPLCLYILHYVDDMDAAEDLAQECFSALWEKVTMEHVEVTHIKAYLYATARNLSLNYVKKESLYAVDHSLEEWEDVLTDEEMEDRSIREAQMWTVIDSLPERCREIFLLNKRDGLKYKEIAERLDISVHTVDNHITKALRLIREGVHQVYLFFFG